jgi:hypothetical protein
MSSCSSVDAWLKLGRFRCRRSAAERERSKKEAMSERHDRLAGRAGARPYRILAPLFDHLDRCSHLNGGKEPPRLRAGHPDATM